MVGIRELAQASGVSIATVSRALNDRAEVSPRTRARILGLARELGYSPNSAARTLARQRSTTIGLVWDTWYHTQGRRHPFLADLLVGLKVALSADGYHLLLLSTDADATGDQDTYLRLARQHHLDGVIIMGIDERLPAVAALVASEVPCVAIDLAVEGPRSSYVTSDNRAGAASAVRHLAGLGHRRIATITGPLRLTPAAERLDGYRAELRRLGLGYRPELVVEGDFFLASGRSAMARLLGLGSPPTAVFVAGDEMAIGAVGAITDAGLSIPGDIALVGFDDIEAAALVRPALTTVAQDRDAFGTAAAAELMRLITRHAGDEPAPAPQVLATRLVVRESCGAAWAG
jgi:LacI family transcriptional regulator